MSYKPVRVMLVVVVVVVVVVAAVIIVVVAVPVPVAVAVVVVVAVAAVVVAQTGHRVIAVAVAVSVQLHLKWIEARILRSGARSLRLFRAMPRGHASRHRAGILSAKSVSGMRSSQNMQLLVAPMKTSALCFLRKCGGSHLSRQRWKSCRKSHA